MKKAVITGVLSMFSIGFAFAQTGNENLPQNSKDFIAQHFSSETITFVEKDNSWLPWDNDDMYEVYFSNGLELNFNKAGELTEVEAPENAAVPTDILPANILTYVAQNYKDSQISSWSKDGNRQEVELFNGVDLEFDKEGNFLRMD